VKVFLTISIFIILNISCSHKLRRVLRKAIDISEQIFKTNKLLSELTNHVAISLGEFYPEIYHNLNKVKYLIFSIYFSLGINSNSLVHYLC
jgi:alanyl-tRNA synthetase